ncbi:hypothetical protein KH5_23370 [Urechidicola sp. KH5]
MEIPKSKATLIAYSIPVLMALIIILDFALPGTKYNEEVTNIERERQNYYNAGGNYHYTYEVVTPTTTFTVEEDFAKQVKGKEIGYTVSLFFKEVNKHYLLPKGTIRIHSFRIATGLVYPLFVIFMIFIAYRYKKNWDTLLFVLQVVLLADLFLLMQ